MVHEENGRFVDRTFRLDPVASEVCARTAGFSRFAAGELAAGRVPLRGRRLSAWR